LPCAAGAWHGRGLVCYASSGKEGNRSCQNTPDTTYDPKGVLKKAGCNTAGDAYTALNEYMY